MTKLEAQTQARQLAAALEIAVAERDTALDALGDVLAHVRRIGGYVTPEDQAALWRANSVLARHGRKVER